MYRVMFFVKEQAKQINSSPNFLQDHNMWSVKLQDHNMPCNFLNYDKYKIYSIML